MKAVMVDTKRTIIYLPVFLGLTCIYFWEIFLKGAVLAVGDGFDQAYPLMVTMANQFKDLTFPFWNPYMFSGFPLFGSMQPGALYPFHIVLPLLFSPVLAFNLNLVIHFSLAGFFTFLYARQIGLGIFPSFIAGTVFSLLGYLPSHLIHPSIITSGIWIPLLLFFYDRLKQNLKGKDVIYASLVIAVQIFAGHPQICFYTCLLLMLYVLFHLFYQDPPKRLRFLLFGTLPLALGMLIALPQIIATYELSTMGTRVKTTYEFFSSFAFPVYMIPTFLFPFFYYYGGNDGDEMWGLTPELGMDAFVGTLPFLLAVLVIMRWQKDPNILFWGMIAILAFALALGDAIRPLNKLLFHLPGYNSFRGPSKHILEMSFALSVLSGFGISFLQKREKRFGAELLWVLSGVIVVSLVSSIFFDGAIRDFLKTSFSQLQHMQLRWERSDIPGKALGITDGAVYIPVLAMSGYLACSICLSRTNRGHFRTAAFLAMFLILFSEALLCREDPLTDAGTLKNHHKGTFDAIVSAGNSGRTVFMSGNPLPLNGMIYGIRLGEGYDPLVTEDYLKLLPAMYTQSAAVCRAIMINNWLLSMMHVKYLVTDNVLGSLEDARWHVVRDEKGKTFPFPSFLKGPAGADFLPIYRKLASFPSYSVYENVVALPRAYPVARLTAVSSADEVRQNLFSFRMNPWQEAAVSAEDLQEIGAGVFSSGDVKVEEEGPDRVTMSARFKGRGFVVLADQFYPGWEAYVDGRQTKIYKANGVLRGIVVPEGEHTLIFRYVPRHIYAALLPSGIVLTGMLFFLLKKRPSSKGTSGRRTISSSIKV